MSKNLEDLGAHLRQTSLRTTGGPFTLRSGFVSDWYLDARQTTFDGGGALITGRAVLEQLSADVEAVGGMTMGADPIAVATAVVASSIGRALRAFSIRKEVKGHGVGGRLVGPVRKGDRVAALEDTTTTGAALMEAMEVMAEAGLEVVEAIVLVDRSEGKAADLVAGLGITLRALVTPETLGVT